MKILCLNLVFAFLATTVLCAERPPDLMIIVNSCLSEAKVTEQEVKDFYKPDVNFDGVSPNIKCHVKCVMEKLGHLKGGVYDADKAMQDWKAIPELVEFHVDPSKFATCKNEKGPNECETAFKINKCLREKKA